VDTGPQNWKAYTVSLLLVNALMFIWGFLLLAVQPLMPFNYNLHTSLTDNSHEFLAPTTILNTVCSFLTNTNLQDYSGEVHLTYFTQVFFIIWNMVPVRLGRLVCALAGIIRAFARRQADRQLLRRHVGASWSTCSCRSPS